MKILITGGSGFIGTNLIEYYLNKGVEVMNIDIKPPKNVLFNIYWKDCDIRNYDLFKKCILDFNPQYIVHLAALANFSGRSIEDYSSNTIGVENLVNIANEVRNIEKVIFTSTMLVCKAGYQPINDNDYCPVNLYGQSKVIGEKIVKSKAEELNYKWAIIRPTSIWGPWFGKNYRSFFEMISKRKYFNFTGKMCEKTYGYVGNIVYQIDSILMSDLSNGRTLYIGDYQPTKIKEWADEIAKIYGVNIPTIPVVIIKILALFGDLLKKMNLNFPINSFRLKNMTTDNIINLEETRKIAPLTIFSRQEGNMLTIEWMNSHPHK